MNPLKYLPASGFTIDPKALRKKWWGVSVWTAPGFPAVSTACKKKARASVLAFNRIQPNAMSDGSVSFRAALQP
jgi:hypothetical protein